MLLDVLLTVCIPAIGTGYHHCPLAHLSGHHSFGPSRAVGKSKIEYNAAGAVVDGRNLASLELSEWVGIEDCRVVWIS